jgi:transcriptional regulator with XRE-family HTH domain
LRRLREQAGLSGDEVAVRLGWSGSKVSRIETHRTSVKPDDLLLLLDLYGVDKLQRGQLRALAEEQEGRGWWAAYSDALSEDYAAYISLESAATSIRTWSLQLIHGLLQTEDYARAVIEAHKDSTGPIPRGGIRRLVETRLRRQEMLIRQNHTQLTFVLDEAVLLRRFGTPAVMKAQLESLTRAAQLPNVTLQILTLAGNHPIGTGSFAILQFAPVHGAALDDVVYVEQLIQSSYVENEAETFRYQQAYAQLIDEALDPSASVDLISRVAAERWS